MDAIIFESVWRQRFAAQLFSAFAIVALGLALLGTYGVMVYTVTQRTQEIGIRVALGAWRRDVLNMVLGQGVRLALAGVAAGLAGALAVTRLMNGLLYDVTATDPATFLSAAALLVTVALLASYIPARRATKVDPMVALRQE